MKITNTGIYTHNNNHASMHAHTYINIRMGLTVTNNKRLPIKVRKYPVFDRS